MKVHSMVNGAKWYYDKSKLWKVNIWGQTRHNKMHSFIFPPSAAKDPLGLYPSNVQCTICFWSCGLELLHASEKQHFLCAGYFPPAFVVNLQVSHIPLMISVSLFTCFKFPMECAFALLDLLQIFHRKSWLSTSVLCWTFQNSDSGEAPVAHVVLNFPKTISGKCIP